MLHEGRSDLRYRRCNLRRCLNEAVMQPHTFQMRRRLKSERDGDGRELSDGEGRINEDKIEISYVRLSPERSGSG